MSYSLTCLAFHVFWSNKTTLTSSASSSPKSASFSIRYYLISNTLKWFSWGHRLTLPWLYLDYLEIMNFMAKFFDGIYHVCLVSFPGLDLLASLHIHSCFNSLR